MIKLYNSLTKTIEELKPINPKEVTVYSCGPTVYDYPHIGNWYSFIRYDLLIRTLTLANYSLKWVINITDVGHLTSDADDGEDKIHKTALANHQSAWEISKFYSQYFIDGMSRLNFIKPYKIPYATNEIDSQIDFINKLQELGYTYEIAGDGIYFDSSKFPRYADFARLNLSDEDQEHHRIELNPNKRHPSDFALWKFSLKDSKRDMEWESPFGTGFPGWHIECSAMCLKYLGPTIDIHAGGIDHIPIHHTNEIAQSEALNNKPLAHIWLHNNHVLINNEKISKSLGNGITLEDILSKGFSLNSFRLLVVESHYRSQSQFNFNNLKSAQIRLNRIAKFAELKYQLKSNTNEKETITPRSVFEAMENDLNSPKSLAYFDQFISNIDLTTLSKNSVEQITNDLNNLYGIKLVTKDITEDQKDLIKARQSLREIKDFNGSDKIRDQLLGQGLELTDSPIGTLWSRTINY